MGEKSKSIGDFGEETVFKLLEMIGWDPLVRNQDIGCMNPDVHQLSSTPRQNHGVDFIFRYITPLFDNTEDLILVSSKYNEQYPDNPASRFKAHLRDITDALYCYKRGKKYDAVQERKAYEKNFIGVIFWLCDTAPYDSMIDKLAQCNFKNEVRSEFEYVYLVDNKRARFLYSTISYVRALYAGKEVSFLYPDTGYNNTARGRQTKGKILPVQYINSAVLPFKVVDTSNGEEVLVLCLDEDFDKAGFTGLLNLSHKLSDGWGQKIDLLFSAFDAREGANTVNEVKQSFRDSDFVKKVYVDTYAPTFRNQTIRNL